MKMTRRLLWPELIGHWSVFFTLGLACSSFADSSITSGPVPADSTIPVVTIQATDPFATWSGNPGVFTVFRAGNPVPSLNVYYQTSGAASNGVDYQAIGHWVSLPSGVLSNDIVIKPINLGQTDKKDVTLELTPSPLMGPLSMPINYLIGSPSNAMVVISPGPAPTNYPPRVRLVAPTNGTVFYTPVDIPIVACANDLDGFVTQVEFFADNLSLGIVTNSPRILPAILGPLPPIPPFQPFVLVWSNVPPRSAPCLLAAKATDNHGASTLSAPVSITVLQGPPPPPPPQTNRPPLVRITCPPNGAVFRAPIDLPLYAYAADPDGYVTKVGFFAGTNFLGPAHRLPSPLVTGGLPVPPPIALTNLWVLIWSNAPPGAYPLTAVAADNAGATAPSAPVNIAILPPLPPPPPLLPVVSIVARDPIAIAGTNCWPWLGLAAAPSSWNNWTASTAVCRYFTNCGPRNALFEVRRLGSTNDSLTVAYGITGTATNGLDYVPLPGTIDIPPGARTALIPLVPIDDGPPRLPSTVILNLKPNPAYLIGTPARAAAIILHGPMPRPLASLLPDMCFHLGATGPDGAWFHIEYSTDLLHWTPICTNQVFAGAIDFVDPDAQAGPARFYRALPESGPPAN